MYFTGKSFLSCPPQTLQPTGFQMPLAPSIIQIFCPDDGQESCCWADAQPMEADSLQEMAAAGDDGGPTGVFVHSFRVYENQLHRLASFQDFRFLVCQLLKIISEFVQFS